MSEGDTIPMRGSADMWRSRAKAAEAEISAARSVAGGFVKPPFDGSLAGAIDAISMRCASAEAEVARLREAWEKRGEHMQNWERDYFRVCKERDAALAESNNLIVKVQFAEAVIRDEKQIERTATEAALRWAWGHDPFVSPYDKWMGDGLKALLEEGE